MRAGTLRDIVILQKLQPSEEGGDWGPTPFYEDEARLYASVIADSGSETTGTNGVTTAINFTVRLRYRADITATDRLAWNGRILDILSVRDPTGKRAELEVKAVENPGVGNA